MKRTCRILYYITLFSFFLGIHEGYIALWKISDPNPVKVFPYQAQLLPPEEQEKLKKGIQVEDSADLTRILEDYTS